MSVTEERTSAEERPRPGELLALVDARLPPDRAPAVREFASAYVRRLSADAASGHGVEELFNEVLRAFELADGRGAPVAVRALNPTVAEHGYHPAGSVLETNSDDLPFLVDSVTAELTARGLGIARVLHPIIGTQRGPDGRIERVMHPSQASATESVMHFELDRRLSPEELADLEDGVRKVLADVRSVVGDHDAMAAAMGRMAHIARAGSPPYPPDETDETVAFLHWLADDNFIFLGAREYAIEGGAIHVVQDSGLGLLADTSRSAYARPVPLEELGPAVRERALHGDLLIVAKTNRLSPVHRRVRMDYVGVRIVGPDGEIAGEARMIGLFTTKAYAQPASEIPLLGRKLRQIIAAEDLAEGSHDYKAVVSLFESFPKDELFAAPAEDLRRAVITLLGVRPDQTRLMAKRSSDGREKSLIVALPKARYDAGLLERLRALFASRFGAATVEAYEVLSNTGVRVHFSVHVPSGDVPDGGVPEPDFTALRREVAELARTWEDRARERLVEHHGDERGRVLAKRWARRLPESYKAEVDPAAAARDIACFERLLDAPDGLIVGLRNECSSDGVELTRIGLFRAGGKVELSRAMPILENLGLRVIEERPSRLLGDEAEAWLQDFGVLGPDDRPLDLDATADRLADCIVAIWRGATESDSLHRLLVTTDLDWERLAILRAYRKYRQRIGSRFTEGYQIDVLAANAAVAAKLMRYFELRFDTARPRDEQAERVLRDEILSDLDDVPSLDHDRILRNQLGLIEATVRTNAYKPGRGAIAFKLRSGDVPAIPQPPPLFEIYVYSPEVEGIHLRGGRIARGGIRWSDRMDYRTEVFGLMRAQMTKNAVIVPWGAKGGFYLKRPPADPAALRAEVERQYVAYISGLLDLTDNRVDGAIVHPDGVRILDEDDSYLVVAADKGTATLSDTANAISERRGFWLGDAFASGGSKGYDHKKLGITARGAWESVERHLRELDLDPAADEFTVAGIGDMSGDVFGNGMLLSDRIRLVAAYDHRHVFIDPDPDAGFAERRRLFELPGSSWDDYDRSAISEGGGVWPRAAKSIPLSVQAREALGVDDEALPPNEVIRAILRAPVDLLFNGGIGTVVKASTETDDDALDRSSDGIRVDASQLRCRVVGEGGNLGLTQNARIEFARGGGLVNADFIDNSAGVDSSDHEVNLKILLGLAVRRDELAPAGRDELLAAVTDDVVQHVLHESFLQAQILAQEVRGSAGRMFAYEDLMTALEEEGMLVREAESLPGSHEMSDRVRAGLGMERPELAVLLAYAKRSLTDALLESGLPDDPALEADLRGYFPAAVVERLGHLLGEHPLRRELIATIAANNAVDALGPTFVSRLVTEQGAEPAAVVRAYRIAREVTGADARWDAIERLERSVDRGVQWGLMDDVDWLVEVTTRWYLASAPGADLAAAIATGREGFERLAAALPAIDSDERRDQREHVAAELLARGVPEPMAHGHAALAALVHAPDAIAVAQTTGRPVEDVARAFMRLGAELRLAWLEDEIEALPATTRMQRWAAQAVRDDVLDARRRLAQRALLDAPDAPAEDAVATFLAARAGECARMSAFARALNVEGAADLAGLTLAVRQLRALVD